MWVQVPSRLVFFNIYTKYPLFPILILGEEDNCTSCNNGEYLEKNECKKCHEDCNTCEKGVENDKQNLNLH